MHKYTQETIDRAITQRIKITDVMVSTSNTLREVAVDFVSTYKGVNGFVQNLAVWLADRGSLSVPQMRGALNVMIAEAQHADRAVLEAAEDDKYLAGIGMRRATAEDAKAIRVTCASGRKVPAVLAPIDAETQKGADYYEAAEDDDDQPAYIDLRSKKEKETDEAASIIAPATAEGYAQKVPNGTYTVLLASGGYRTIRLKDAPEHMNKPAGTQIAAFLSGADNESAYTKFAFVFGNNVGVWSRFKTGNSESVIALKILVASADPMSHMREYVKRSNCCGVCGRKLTTPESIAAGIGPICAANLERQGFIWITPDTVDAVRADQARAVAEIDELFPE